MRRAALILCLTCSCTAKQARRAHSAGEVALAGGLFGVLGGVVAAELVPSHRSALLADSGLAFGSIAILGALVYAATDSIVNAPVEEAPTARERARAAALDLAKQAKHAARVNDCAEVQAIQPRVRDLDESIYRRFLHDNVIRQCLEPAPQP